MWFLQVLKSKTVWTAIGISLLTASSEYLQDWISDHPHGAGQAAAFVLILLRVMTVGPLVKGSDGAGTDDSK